jgi:hypothetical protein
MSLKQTGPVEYDRKNDDDFFNEPPPDSEGNPPTYNEALGG